MNGSVFVVTHEIDELRCPMLMSPPEVSLFIKFQNVVQVPFGVSPDVQQASKVLYTRYLVEYINTVKEIFLYSTEEEF